MRYWLIYCDDFSDKKLSVKDFACFKSKEGAQKQLNDLVNDENLWWHIIEICENGDSHFLRQAKNDR